MKKYCPFCRGKLTYWPAFNRKSMTAYYCKKCAVYYGFRIREGFYVQIKIMTLKHITSAPRSI